MSDFLDRISKLSPKRLALLALEQHEQLAAAQVREPIAIIGIGCRFPGGADSPQAYWALLQAGRDAIRDVPADRWDKHAWFDADPDAAATMSVRTGGFLDDVSGFDAEFFGISPREALSMDPQQRLLLEVAWEAIEHAGISPESLVGSPTGAFVGLCNSDHFIRLLGRGADSIDAYLASGNAPSVASGRLAYFLGLRGPAMSIDTACSSSLVALHTACRSVRSGESRLALACGVNLMCSPETTVALTKSHMLAPDGRCKTFDAAADGFARGEGCGVLVLKRLSDARTDGDRVLAVIRGSAINQDGRSGGLTVPNGPAQEAVIGAALGDAGLAPADIDYVEAHGTGTSLGDPIEVRALAGALGPGRGPGNPLLIGSVKTNLGHLEAAAGVAGVIKVVLALQHEHLPAHLHFRQPSPHIAWSDYPVEVVAEGRPWRSTTRPRRAGVSSFGFSGTNAHVIVEEAPLEYSNTTSADLWTPLAEHPGDGGSSAISPERPVHLLALSARTASALRQLALGCAQVLATPGVSLADVAYSAATGRAHFAERLAIVAENAADARAALAAFIDGQSHPALQRACVPPGSAPEVVFLYTGQGAQSPGMGAALYLHSPVYRAAIDRCDELLGADAHGRTLRSVLRESTSSARAAVHETLWTQPALFAVEYALTQLWASWGVKPAAVIGHSVGEYAAACAAGVFSVEDGLRLIRERGRLMQALPAGGAMAAIFASEPEVQAALSPYADRVAIAAINAPDSVVVSGESTAVQAVLARLAERDIQGHPLLISLAGHSPLMDPALDAMEACAAHAVMRAPVIPVAWNLTGGAPLASGAAPDARYWRRHLREPVRFADGITALHRDGFRTFLEVGPHPTLVALAQRSLPDSAMADRGLHFANSLRRTKSDWHEIMSALAGLYVRGAGLDWAGVDRPYSRSRITLPTYPFERRRFWVMPETDAVTRRVGSRAAASGDRTPRPLRGTRLPTALPVFETLLAPDAPAYLGEHRLLGAALVAGPVFLEIAQTCALSLKGPGRRAIESFEIHEPLVLPDAGRLVQLHFLPEVTGTLPFSVHSRAIDAPSAAWQLHATGRLVDGVATVTVTADKPTPPAGLLAAPRAACADYYETLADLGIALGSAFRSLLDARKGEGQVLTTLQLPAVQAGDAVTWAHPCLLDGALQSVGLCLPAAARGDAAVYLLTGIERIDLAAPLPVRLRCHAVLRDAAQPVPPQWQADVTLSAEDGTPLGSIRGVSLRRAGRDALSRAVGSPAVVDDLYYGVAWEPSAIAPSAAPRLRRPGEILPALRHRFDELATSDGMAVYDALLPELDRLAFGHLAVALRRLGFAAIPGRVFGLLNEATALGVVDRHVRLFGRLLQILAEEGNLRPLGEARFEVLKSWHVADPASRYDELLQRFAPVDGELSTLRRCGEHLAAVLRGAEDPLHLLFVDGTLAEARKLYVDSPFARTYNAALVEALRAASADLPAGSRLRVLEIGAGTGGTTAYVLPALAGRCADYLFTDLSPLFLERAALAFQAYPFFRHGVLDIERDPATQGVASAGFDVVIAANVLHATADLRQALRHAHALLAPGGLLLLLEGMRPERWIDLTFGLTDGWWRFTDVSLRPDYPLVHRTAWLNLLTEVGFEEAAAVPEGPALARGAAQQGLLLARKPIASKCWTLVGGPAGLTGLLAAELRDRGDRVVLCGAGDAAAATDPADAWVYLGALQVDAAAAPAEASALACGLPLQALTALSGNQQSGRVWLATCGAQPALPNGDEGARFQAMTWGVGRVYSLEQPTRFGGLVDLQPGAGDSVHAAQLLATIDADDDEDQVAWRDGVRSVCRLRRMTAPDAQPITLSADATYLVTGGFGGLGLLVAAWLAERGARHIALLGRHPDVGSEAVQALRTAGVHVIALAADVTDEAAMRVAMREIAAVAPPLRGILHAAAAFSSATIAELEAADVEAMLAPKVTGTQVLARVSADAPLDFLVLFSSTTALLGAAGLAHYAAANLFLDATAQAADSSRRRVLSVNWGTWEAMRLASARERQKYLQSGLLPMSAGDALDALGRLLATPLRQAMVARIDWSVLLPLHEARRKRPMLTGLATPIPAAEPVSRGGAAPVVAAGWLERLTGVGASQRPELLADWIGIEVAAVLGLGPHDIVPTEKGLFDMGMDSLMTVELRRRLERQAGCALPSTLTFNYPTVAKLAAYLDDVLAVADESPAAAPMPAAAVDAGVASAAGAEDLDTLSDDELESRLIAMLEQSR